MLDGIDILCDTYAVFLKFAYYPEIIFASHLVLCLSTFIHYISISVSLSYSNQVYELRFKCEGV